MNAKSPIPRDPKHLIQLLRDYLLSSENSMMSAVVQTIIEADIGDKTISVLGVKGEALGRVERILTRLGIGYTTELRSSFDYREVMEWIAEKELQGETCVYVPAGLERFRDFPVLVPFSIEKAVSDLKDKGYDLETPKVQMQYLIYLRSFRFHRASIGGHRDNFEEKIKSDVIKSMRGGPVMPRAAMGEGNETFKSIHSRLMEMSRKALFYTGCVPFGGYWKDIRDARDVVSQRVNLISRNIGSVVQPDDVRRAAGIRKRLRSEWKSVPAVKRNMELSLRELVTVERNLQSMETIGFDGNGHWQVVPQKVITRPIGGGKDVPPWELEFLSDDITQCLEQRLAGVPERIICQLLGKFPDEYESWLRHNHIDLAPSSEDSAYDRWLAAAKELGLDHAKEPPAVVSLGKAGEVDPEVESDRAKLPVLNVRKGHGEYGVIEMDDQSERLKHDSRLFKCLSFIVREQSKCVEKMRVPMFDRVALCEELKIPDGDSRDTALRDILRGTRYDGMVVKLDPPVKNKRWMKIDSRRSRVDTESS